MYCLQGSRTAPFECGNGSVTTYFSHENNLWTHKSRFGTPNALVACNAGLAPYPEWVPVIRDAHRINILFGVTDCAEQLCEIQQEAITMMLYGVPGCVSRSEYPIGINPFQRSRQRSLSCMRLPNVCNGFTLTVVKKMIVKT